MGQSLEEIIANLGDGAQVAVTIVSNEDDGVASYAFGTLLYRRGNLAAGGSLPTTLEGSLPMYFSDRINVTVTPGSPPTNFGNTVTQPFRSDATEQATVSIELQVGIVMHLGVFGTNTPIRLTPMGDLLVGLGPSLSRSAAGVFVASFRPAPLQPG